MADLRPDHPAPATPENGDERSSRLSFVAHEVRNPLSTALWSAELLARMSSEERGGPRGEKLARMTLRAVGRLQRLVEDHLLLSRLDAGGVPVELEDLPVRELFPAAAVVGASSLELDLEPGLTAVGDPALARRLLEGVLLAASRGGVAVRVSGRRRGGVVRLTVLGAPPAGTSLDEPLRGDPGDGRGAALALPLGRRLAGLLGGELRVDAAGYLVELPSAEARRTQG